MPTGLMREERGTHGRLLLLLGQKALRSLHYRRVCDHEGHRILLHFSAVEQGAPAQQSPTKTTYYNQNNGQNKL